MSNTLTERNRRAAGLCAKCGKVESVTRYCEDCKRIQHAHQAQRVRNMKDEVITAYGGACACCGETIRTFLTLDHANNDGYLDRLTSRCNNGVYAKARREGYPPTYQVLCFNCNCGRAVNGGVCPHQE